ncbi:MAG: hemerythrin domain-containing protein [Proteobacteria bacterium]|nr:hemerythrin domain-containing protein [Pseudomonadota bacterium]
MPDTRAELSSLWDQDVEIDGLVRNLVKAVEGGESDAAKRAIDELEDYVLTHLQREEEVYFPAAERLSPDFAYALKSIRLAHLGIREDLRLLRASLERGHLDAARTQLAAFLESFRAHEQAEDRVVRELGGSRGSN